MAAVSILDQIRKLVELQKLDVEIYEFKRVLKEKPALIDELSKKFESQKAHLKELEEKFKVSQVERKSLELELQTKEGEIAKHNAQLSQIKTNKEYTAKLSEIEHIKADKSQIEEKILISYDDSDRLSAAITKERAFLAEEEKKFLAQKKECEDTIRELQEKAHALEASRNRIVPEVDKSTLARYERILANKDGLAIVPVINNSCGGCYMAFPPQLMNAIKMHDKILLCEMCARMLYLAEEL